MAYGMNDSLGDALKKQEQLTEETEEAIKKLHNKLNEKQNILTKIANAAADLEDAEKAELADWDQTHANEAKKNIERTEADIKAEESFTQKYQQLTEEEEEILSQLVDFEKDIEGLEMKIEQMLDDA